jgi:peptidoglycan/LPS O-acetylase OafA/YrhL
LHVEARSAGLDALRALAALTVALAHSLLVFYSDNNATPLRMVFLAAAYAVDLFFVLSGFLVGRILLEVSGRSTAAITTFAWRRWWRTVPNYILFLLLNIIVWKWVQGQFPEHGRYWLFAQNFAWSQPMFFVESWSLAVEEWFYVLVVLAALLVHRGGGGNLAQRWFLILAGIVIASIALRIVMSAISPALGWDLGGRKITVLRLDGLAYGMLVALWLRQATLSRAACIALSAAGLIAVSFATALPLVRDIEREAWMQVIMPCVTGLGFAALLPIAAAYRYQLADKATFGAKVLRWLADISFALYLTNLLCYRVLEWGLKVVANGVISPQVFVIVNLAASIALAAACFHFFERPILRWRDRRYPASSPESTQVASLIRA